MFFHLWPVGGRQQALWANASRIEACRAAGLGSFLDFLCIYRDAGLRGGVGDGASSRAGCASYRSSLHIGLVHAGLNSLAAGSAPQCLYAAMRPQSQARANRQAMCAKLY